MKRVLIVDDNEINRILIRDILNVEDFELHEAVDGRLAIAEAQRLRPDLILMDIQMPNLDGLAATRLLKEDEATKDIPVIALTSYAFDKDRQAFLAAGGDVFISKPIMVDEFLQAVWEILQGANDRP